MSNALRELVLSLRIKADKAGIKEVDQAFDHAAKSATFFENGAYKALKKVGEQLDANAKKAREFAKALLPAGALPTAPRPPAPSDRRAQQVREALGMHSGPQAPRPGQSLAAPDVSKFLDTRSAPKRAFDSFRESAHNALMSAGQAADRFNAKFDGVVKSVFNARTAFAGLAVVAGAVAIAHFVGDVVEAGAELHTMAQRTRMSVETLQVWRTVAEGVNADAGAVEGAFQKLSKAIAGAAKGGKAQAAAFKDLGVEFKNRSTEDVLIDTGAALAALGDDAKASALAVQLLGPAGAALVPAFKNGSAAVRKLTADLRENVVMNAEEAARLEEVGSAVDRGTKKWTALKQRAIILLLPLLEALSSGFEKVSKWVLRMVKETSTLQAGFAALTGLGIGRMVTMLISWVSRVGGARAALSLLSGGLRTAAMAAAEIILPFLLIEDFLTFLQGGKSVFGRAFEEIFGEGGAQKAREGILKVFQDISKVLTEDVMPVIRDIANSPFVTGVMKVAGETFLGLLNLIGIAFTDDSKKIDELGDRFMKNTAGMSDAIDKLIAKVKDFFGMGGDGPTLTPPPALTAASQALAQKSKFFADQPEQAQSWRDGFGVKPGTVPTMPAIPGVVPAPAAPPQPKQLNLTDNRKIEVNVGPNATPGATGRAVVDAVTAYQQVDQRQILRAVSF
jgi:hypothetical protein